MNLQKVIMAGAKDDIIDKMDSKIAQVKLDKPSRPMVAVQYGDNGRVGMNPAAATRS